MNDANQISAQGLPCKNYDDLVYDFSIAEAQDIFVIQEVTLYQGEYSDKVYSVDGEILDGVSCPTNQNAFSSTYVYLKRETHDRKLFGNEVVQGIKLCLSLVMCGSRSMRTSVQNVGTEIWVLRGGDTMNNEDNIFTGTYFYSNNHAAGVVEK